MKKALMIPFQAENANRLQVSKTPPITMSLSQSRRAEMEKRRPIKEVRSDGRVWGIVELPVPLTLVGGGVLEPMLVEPRKCWAKDSTLVLI